MSLIERAFREKIVLVGVTLPPNTLEDTEAGLDELSQLVDTAGADEVARLIQRRAAPDPPTYIGKGKAEELREIALETDCDTVVFDNELTPAQQLFMAPAKPEEELYDVRTDPHEIHNLAKDPPFSRIDLVSCRNVLIYMQPPLQRRLLTLFHYALQPDGLLVLGSSESAADAQDLFAPADSRFKISTNRGPSLPLVDVTCNGLTPSGRRSVAERYR